MRLVDHENKDIIFRMSFHASQHVVQMHNKVWLSSRALELERIKPENEAAVRQALAVMGRSIDELAKKVRYEVSLAGCDQTEISDQVIEIIPVWMNSIYQKYFALRSMSIPTENIGKQHALTLMHDYCTALKSEPVVQDFWVRLTYGNNILDSRELGFQKSGA